MEAITFLIPTFNHWAYLPEAVRSIQALHDVKARILVCDDGSTDPPPYDPAKLLGVEFFRKENSGTASTLNYMFRLVDTELLGVLNDDDVLMAHHATLGTAVMRASGHLFVGRARPFGSRTEVGRLLLHQEYADRTIQAYGLIRATLKSNWAVSSSAFLLRSDLYSRINGFDAGYLFAPDLDFLVRAIVADARVFFAQRPSWHYRLHSKNTHRYLAHLHDEEIAAALAPLARRLPKTRIGYSSGVRSLMGSPTELP